MLKKSRMARLPTPIIGQILQLPLILCVISVPDGPSADCIMLGRG